VRRLHPCARCLRHIRGAEPKCPFCGLEQRAERAGRALAAAATLVGATSLGCVSHPDAGPRDPQAAAPAPRPPPEATTANTPLAPAAIPGDAGSGEIAPPPRLRTVAIYGDSAGLVTARVQFRAGEVLIRSDQNETLAMIAMMMAPKPPQSPDDGQFSHLEIEGHADATEKGGQWLSRRRAELVRDALVALGVPPEKLSIHAHGAERPLVPSDSPEHRQLNRRVSFQVTPRE